MSDTPRQKMSIENRAKQFAPFNSLPGLYEALARVEEEVELASKKKTAHNVGGPQRNPQD